MKLPSTELLVDGILEYFDGCTTITTDGLRQYCSDVGYTFTTINARLTKAGYKSGRGKFNLTKAEQVAELEKAYEKEVETESNFVPQTDDKFVQFGHFKDIKSIIKSRIFYPLFITGLSGNGKTHSVEQSCAQLSRECVRVNITIETDEDDLIGGFRLKDGETVWSDGPVVEALKRGAVLLLDEIDLASNKIMCLQSVLEGKGVYLKKTNQYVRPEPGFNVVATANTKGKGSESGMFIGTNVLNEAFLERFSVTFEQQYPTPAIEKKILLANFKEHGWVGDNIDTIAQNLVDWSDIIRKTFYDGGIEDIITTRRLINIVKAYVIWDSMEKAIELCTNRFDDDTAKTFRDLYQKVSGDDTLVETPTLEDIENEVIGF